MAIQYPSALYYPILISRESYPVPADQESATNIGFVDKICAVLKSPLLEKFSEELQRLTDRNHVVKEWAENLAVKEKCSLCFLFK